MEENQMKIAENYSEVTKEIIEVVGCPFKVYEKGADGREFFEVYKSELERGKKEGFIPVIVGADETLAEWFGILEDESYSREKVLSRSGVENDGKEIIESRFNGYMEDAEDDGFMEDLTIEGEEGDKICSFSSNIDYRTGETEETIIFEIPVKNPWEVIAYLPMGGWNECPDAEEMIAVCKYWYEEYGAVPASISHDVLEFYVEKPVADKEKAFELAKEHYAFCPDRVDQCTQSYSLSEVADSIAKSNVWYFWWD